jgi:hypothetical protein
MTWQTIREWWQPALAVALTIAIVILFILLIPALGTLSDQAKAGDQAKQRQCSTAPAAAKVYRDAYQRRVINRADLAEFVRSRPKHCPDRAQ